MKENINDYDTYYISGHGSIDPSKKLFTKVPKDVIFVICTQNIDSLMISGVSELNFTKSIIEYGDKFLRESLLVENQDLPNTHVLKNKAIYMSGSCVPNLSLLFTDATISTGVFKASQLQEELSSSFQSTKKMIPDRLSYFKKTIGLGKDQDLMVENILSLLESKYTTRQKRKKIVYISVCTAMQYEKIHNPYMYEDLLGITKSEAIKLFENIEEKDKNKIELDFLSALSECTRNCYLYSLELFTKKFDTFDSDKIPSYLKIGEDKKSIIVSDVNIKLPHRIISDELIYKYVKVYFDSKISLGDKIKNFLSKWLGFTDKSNVSNNKSLSKSSSYRSIPDEELNSSTLNEYLQSDEYISKYKDIKKNIQLHEVDKNIYEYICSQTNRILQDTELYKEKMSKLKTVLKRKKASSSSSKKLIRKRSRYI